MATLHVALLLMSVAMLCRKPRRAEAAGDAEDVFRAAYTAV